MIIVGEPLTSEEYRVMLAHFAIADLGYVPDDLKHDAWHAREAAALVPKGGQDQREERSSAP